VVKGKLQRRLRVRGARRARRQREGVSDAQAKKGKSAGAGDKPLISLETAKENVWKSLEKAWIFLGKAWKNLNYSDSALNLPTL
jgi:hypothetical protein